MSNFCFHSAPCVNVWLRFMAHMGEFLNLHTGRCGGRPHSTQNALHKSDRDPSNKEHAASSKCLCVLAFTSPPC